MDPLRLDFDDVLERLYLKFAVTQRDCELAGNYLRCFLHAKISSPKMLIILPQIADWAWHELILDTRLYREICAGVFGGFLHHVIKDIHVGSHVRAEDMCEEDALTLRRNFKLSLAFMRQKYALTEISTEWTESGWDSPRYRFRNASYAELLWNDLGEVDKAIPPRFSWLPARIALRFGVTEMRARNAVAEYANAFGCGKLDKAYLLPPAVELVWQEHILWTRRYAEDCNNAFGYFADHLPRDVLGTTLERESGRFAREPNVALEGA
ncbi:hypothetical protein EDF57_103202 [Novosphingobium sp. PhB55]|uniref:hypothetical protein n=1 Tax=Novosphingobium sp. PhB55 TaxID=2485106 RepID=UPI001066B95A|nr:hypothetical protein [Novosphingobium sp. PhB55]TDW65026.1 hypothetical protein EDF57_103202 [Novosphingobium sp. PhB55]